MRSKKFHRPTITILGLGYVGLPLATAFAKYYLTYGYDISEDKIDKLKNGFDSTNQIMSKDLKNNNLIFTNDPKSLKKSNIIIVSVPTPVDKKNKPDIRLLKSACKTIGNNLTKKTTIVFESTVYPGLTEEICIKEIEKNSKLKWKKDFNIGYSPERINPGDKKNTLKSITKVISGDTKKTSLVLNNVYKKIIKKTFVASSIKVAEAAKIIENTQRDINIAFINELSIICSKLKINIYDVLSAAGTKWNFLNFEPGLVGGHCIGVDPYYLTYKAKKLGYEPQIILSGRKLNNNMTTYVYQKFLKIVSEKFKKKSKRNILILGITFKENCNDFRNSKPIEFYNLLNKNKNFNLEVYDPMVDKKDIKKNYNINIIDRPKLKNYDSIIILVKHSHFLKIKIDKMKSYCKKNFFIFDLKNIFKDYKDNPNIFTL